MVSSVSFSRPKEANLIMKHAGILRILAAIGVTGLLAAQEMSDSAMRQISAVINIKRSFTPAQKKIDSSLVFAAKAVRGELAGTSIESMVRKPGMHAQSDVTVDIYGKVSPELLAAVVSMKGVVIQQFPQWGVIRATLPLASLEAVASHPDVKSIRLPSPARTNAGSVMSQGYISHAANQAIALGYQGSGVTVGVLSDSASASRIAALIATGDLPLGTAALPGQNGSASDEGTAMMEIVHDIAPGANLIFATAFTGEASFASNIIALQAAGAKVIVDNITYFSEGAFEDGTIAQAVNQVTAAGAIYLSSAGNFGNLTSGTSGTWEGDFLSGGAVSGPISALGETGVVHNFGTPASPQDYDVLTVTSDFISLKWSDPLGASTNDYDLYILDSTGTTVKGFSASTQNGTEDPFEFVSQGTNCGTATASGYCPAAGDRIVVVLFSGAARALRIDTNAGRLSIATSGAVYGHQAAASTVTTGATYWNSAKTGTKPFTGFANPNEPFSADGPRKMFFNPNGTAITPGNFLFATNGGTTVQKPDIVAADGVSTRTPGFTPFFGTSAAAAHAAGIAALVLSVHPGYTPAQVRTAMTSPALDSMAPGIDRDSGHGIVMALQAVQYALAH